MPGLPSRAVLAPTRSSSIARLTLLGALGLALHGAGFWLLRDRGPAAADVAAASAALRAEHRAGDAIFLVPAYATRAREYLGDLRPLAVRRPGLEDLELRSRAWVVASFGAEEDARPELEQAGLRYRKQQRFGGVTIELFERAGAAAATRWSALESIRAAQVAHVHDDGRVEACSRWASNARGGEVGHWACPHDADWLYVGPEWHRMGERPRRCLWAHPPKEGRVEVRFEDVPLSGVLTGWAGHTLNASRRAKAPVDLFVQVGEGRGQTFRFELEDTWRPFRMATATATVGTVRFGISSPDNGANHFCFVAETRTPVGEASP